MIDFVRRVNASIPPRLVDRGAEVRTSSIIEKSIRNTVSCLAERFHNRRPMDHAMNQSEQIEAFTSWERVQIHRMQSYALNIHNRARFDNIENYTKAAAIEYAGRMLAGTLLGYGWCFPTGWYLNIHAVDVSWQLGNIRVCWQILYDGKIRELHYTEVSYDCRP